MQRACLSIGARRHNSAIRETRLCLCKAEPPSGAKKGKPPKSGNPLSLEHRLLMVFQKISTPNSLALRRDLHKKPKDQKFVWRPKGRSSRENGLRLWATAAPSPPFAEGRLRSRGISLRVPKIETEGTGSEVEQKTVKRRTYANTLKASTATKTSRYGN